MAPRYRDELEEGGEEGGEDAHEPEQSWEPDFPDEPDSLYDLDDIPEHGPAGGMPRPANPPTEEDDSDVSF